MSTSGTHGFSPGNTYSVLPPFDVNPSLLDSVSNTQEFVPIPGRAMYHKDLIQIAGNGEVHLSQAEYDDMAFLTSPTFTGIPIAPTAAVDTTTTQIATTAFVIGQASNDSPLMNSTVNAGTSKRYSRKDHIHPVDTSRAPTVSPTFTGTVTVPDTSFTYAKLQNVSTTDRILGRYSSGVGGGVIQEITCTAAGRALLDDSTATNQRITIGLGNVTNESKATMFTNAALTGNPTAPTQAADDNSTKIANTAYVDNSADNVKKKMGLYIDTPILQPTVIRNSQMDNTLPISGKEIFKVLSSGEFTTTMIGKRFKCTDDGSSTRDFRQGTTLLLRHHLTAAPWIEDVAANTPLVIDNYYTVVATGTPDTWGGTVLTPEEGIETGKWYIVQTDTITYNGDVYAASTYDPHPLATAYADGQNLSPIIFKGVVGVTTYTGSGTVYELNYMVCNSSTGNGTTIGTITLNWIPNLYNLFNPEEGKEWALHAITYGSVHRDKTLKITGGIYDTKTLNFVVSGSGGYTPFTATDFEDRMVALYNPFNSTFNMNFSTRLISIRPVYAATYDAPSGVFKRRSDGKYCFLLFGVTSGVGRIGYYTTVDFLTNTAGNEGKAIIDGKFTDTYLSSGNLSIGSKYKIITTQLNHFGTDLVVGDFFTASATTTCNANNIVRLMDPLWSKIGPMSSITYLGQTDDGSYLWEGIISYSTADTSGRLGQKIEFLQFDETFSDKYFKCIPIDLDAFMGDANESGVYQITYPFYTYYGGKHRVATLGYTKDVSATYPMYTYEYISNNGKYGPYTTRNVIHVRDDANDAYPYSRDIEYFNYFIYNCKLWALASSTAISAYCGFDAGKRQVNLLRFSDEENTWYGDSRSPVVLSPIYSTTTLWNSQYAQYHLSLITLCIEEGVLHFLVAANDSTNNYTTFHGTLDMKLLGPT